MSAWSLSAYTNDNEYCITASSHRQELLLVAGVEAGLPSAIEQACASVTTARAVTGFYAPDSGTLASELSTLQPAAMLARVR